MLKCLFRDKSIEIKLYLTLTHFTKVSLIVKTKINLKNN